MRTTREIMVPQKITTVKCDTCDFSLETNISWRFRVCTFCNGDTCYSCYTTYSESRFDDYPDATACKVCKPKADLAWLISLQRAGRNDHMPDIVKETFDNFEQYSHFIEEQK